MGAVAVIDLALSPPPAPSPLTAGATATDALTPAVRFGSIGLAIAVFDLALGHHRHYYQYTDALLRFGSIVVACVLCLLKAARVCTGCSQHITVIGNKRNHTTDT